MGVMPLIGTWRLLSYETRTADGAVRPMTGADTCGYLVYTSDGHVLVTIQLRRPPDFASGDMVSATPDEIATTYRSYLSYAGTYEIREARVIHHVEASLYPNWIGGEQVRFYAFEGERLALSTDPVLYEGVESRGYLIWERVP